MYYFDFIDIVFCASFIFIFVTDVNCILLRMRNPNLATMAEGERDQVLAEFQV